jgi:hypothetical protein
LAVGPKDPKQETTKAKKAKPIPDGEMLINDTSPLPRRPARRQARAPDPRSRQEEPLRWDLLSQVRGLFLKQTLPEESPGYPVHRPTSSL